VAIKFACPICKTPYTVNDRDAGKKADCKVCGQRLQVRASTRRKTVLGEELADDYPPAPPPADDPIPADPPPQAESYYEPPRERYDDDPPPRSGMSAGHIGVLIFSVAALLFAVGVVAVILIAKSNDERQPAGKTGNSKDQAPAAADRRDQDHADRRIDSLTDEEQREHIARMIRWFVYVVVYFIPTWIALIRRHNNALAVFMLNLLLGWTCLGWAAAAVWSVLNAPIMAIRRAPDDVA
jgi:hypothetical protein